MKGRPDVEVETAVRAKSLRFGTVPKVRVRFEGEPDHESESEAQRGDLPDVVEPGVAYRDVEVRWNARSRVVHPADPQSPDSADPEPGD